jgi:hypothetical protein
MIQASVGDVVKVNINYPVPHTIVLTLQTPESAAYATELLNDPEKSGWQLQRTQERT